MRKPSGALGHTRHGRGWSRGWVEGSEISFKISLTDVAPWVVGRVWGGEEDDIGKQCREIGNLLPNCPNGC